MPNVNDEIKDRTIRHMVYLERFKNGEVKRVRKTLNREILPDISRKLEKRLARIIERGSDTGATTTKRLKELERELQRLTRDMSDEVRKTLVVDLDELTRDELIWQVNAIQESLDFDLEFVVPPPRAVVNVAKNTAFAGLTLDDWFKTLERSTQRNVMKAVNTGIVEGETTQQIMRRIRGTRKLKYTDGVFETTRRQAEAVTRTTINHVSNQARLELFKENADIISGLQWVATLDSRTSLICAGLDGKVFPIDKGARPPAHVNCRSAMTPVLKNAKALGLPEGKRASVNGQVPSSTTYGEWLKRQPVGVQNEVLGVKKSKLFRDGKLPIERFTSSNLKPLNLDQLRRVEKKAFETAKI